MHGNEPLGVDMVGLLRANPLPGIDSMLANPRAVKAGTRFIDEDLNRVFPGSRSGTYEQRRAGVIMRKALLYDLVLDFHNTQAGQPSCGFVGLQYDAKLLDIAANLGLQFVIEAGYDCVNKYVPNCLSIEICMRDSDARQWYEKLRTLPQMTSTKPRLYRYARRVTWEESKALRTAQWQPFEELPANDKAALGISSSACPIFIGSRLTPFFATLVEKVDN